MSDAVHDNDHNTVDNSGDDPTRQRFQEALARKRERESHAQATRESGRTALPHSNTKRQRTFRRKSG